MEKLTYYSCAKRKTRPICMLFFSISWLQTYYSNIKQSSSSCSRGVQCTCIHTIQYTVFFYTALFYKPRPKYNVYRQYSTVWNTENAQFLVCCCHLWCRLHLSMFFFIHYCHVVATCYSLSFCARDLTQSYRILFLGVCPANKTGTMSSSSITTFNNLWA